MTAAPSVRFGIPLGDEGVDMTVAAVWGLIDAGQSDPRLGRLTRGAIEESERGESRDVFEALTGIFRFGKNAMRFQRDQPGIDTARTLSAILDDIERDGFALGDCVHRAILIASMVKSAGLAPFLVVVGSTPHGRFEHIAAGAIVPGIGFYPLDPQETTKPGTLPPHARRKVYRQ